MFSFSDSVLLGGIRSTELMNNTIDSKICGKAIRGIFASDINLKNLNKSVEIFFLTCDLNYKNKGNASHFYFIRYNKKMREIIHKKYVILITI